MIKSVRFRLSYDRLIKCNFIVFKVYFISMKICIVVTDIVVTLLVPADSVMWRVVITLYMTSPYPLKNSKVIW